MEKVLSPEEKIRRAEEIYLRRRSGYYRNNVAKVSVSEEKDYGLFKKMFLQIAICMLIYFIFYLIQNSNYIFSEDVINKTKEILSYDIDFAKVYTEISSYLSDSILIEKEDEALEAIDDMKNSVEKAFENINSINSEGAIGGIEEEYIEEEPTTNEGYIKKYFSFIKPIEGIVTSEFGPRESTNPIVSKNHTGIDIGANTGTVIKAAMEGKVSVANGIGDYGNHIKIINADITTVYAHCNKLYVKEGDIVSQGQEIAEVGFTGRATRTSFTF